VVKNFLRALFRDVFVITSAGLSSPLIHRTSASSRRSYDYLKAIILIISRFSLVVLSFIRHLYNK
jgi:hypothetical protein